MVKIKLIKINDLDHNVKKKKSDWNYKMFEEVFVK